MIITLARKPFLGTMSDTLLDTQCGGLNIEGCRIPFDGSEDLNNWHSNRNKTSYSMVENVYDLGLREYASKQNNGGRWPANLLLSSKVLSHLPKVNKQAPCKTDNKSGWQAWKFFKILS